MNVFATTTLAVKVRCLLFQFYKLFQAPLRGFSKLRMERSPRPRKVPTYLTGFELTSTLATMHAGPLGIKVMVLERFSVNPVNTPT